LRVPRRIKLWPHQKDAVDAIAPFLQKEVSSNRAPRLSALINIPTGGGKTAVIGTLAHWSPELKKVLVVAPRQAIRDQLAAELAATRGFLKRAGYVPTSLPKHIVTMDSAASLPAPLPTDLILVATIQLIDDMARNKATDTGYDTLAKWCDAIFVDEGHYEPAHSWSQALRGLKRPIVLVTATPYRNDLKSFEIDRSATHVSRYSDLMTGGFLRKLDVVQAPVTALPDPADFVNSVLETFILHYGDKPSPQRKLIIRCKSKEHIRLICDLILSHKDGSGGVLGLHEEFKPDPARPWEQRQPSDPEATGSSAIWVHQHKLLEGVDGPSFRALAFYGVLGSSRALVQQVGRVIRNPKKDTSENALMIDHTAGLLEDRWSRFLEFDQALSQGTMLQGIDELSRAFDKALPPIVYVDRQFRRRFSFGIPSSRVKASLRLPLRCHIYTGNKPSLAGLKTAMNDRLLEAEYPYEIISADENELIILFEKLQSSPLLDEHYFMERALHVFIALRKTNHIAILDTSRPGLTPLCALQVGRPLSRQMTQRLLQNSPDTKLVEVNARNSSVGASTVRKRVVSADSLAETPPALDEFQYIPSSITAVDRSRSSGDPNEDTFSTRSVGFGLARITDASARKKLSEWTAWTAISIPEDLYRDPRPVACAPGVRRAKRPTGPFRKARQNPSAPASSFPKTLL
jgi:superfamily II DNA or RNA helicase